MSKKHATQSGPLPRLSVVVPVFEEAQSLRPLYAELREALCFTGGSFEVIFVDDGSRDASSNQGQSAALAAGFREVRSEFTATLDADLQNDPRDLEKLMLELEVADVVNGVRVTRQDSWVRIVTSRIANGVRNALTGETVSDVGCSLRVMRTSLLENVELSGGLHRFLPTLLRLEGARVTEIPVCHRPRRYGRSKYGIANRLFVGIRELYQVRGKIRAR